jgi:hypothetical protein
MAVELHCTFFAADGKRIFWEGLATGSRGKQQEFKLLLEFKSAPQPWRAIHCYVALAGGGDVPADTRAIFRTAEGATASIPGIVAPQETGDKVWAKAGNVGDALVVQLLLKKQDSGLWRTKKLVVTTPEDKEDEKDEDEDEDEGSEEEEDEDDEGSGETIANFDDVDDPWDDDDPWERHWAQHHWPPLQHQTDRQLVSMFSAMRRRQQTASLQHSPGGGRGGGVTPGKNGPHKVFLRHTQLSARLYETFHCEQDLSVRRHRRGRVLRRKQEVSGARSHCCAQSTLSLLRTSWTRYSPSARSD